ncbi:TIM-barrel domain-containing protein [Phocaeicola sp.]|uniref:TIM-barrel domain-containing protein n=1 Tax=Phocaeicola sp. TaxID=2773926 RepID=UPI002620CB9A|nr:TIM-barrel domain-containing protein [Phocaeicola sp.]
MEPLSIQPGTLIHGVGTSVRKDSKNPPVVRDRNTDQNWEAQPYSDNLEFLVPAEDVEVVLFAGPTMLDVVRRFNLYNGGGALPPRWGLGFWHRVSALFSDKEVNDEVAEFEKREFPLSVIGLEPGWMSRSYQWDRTRFPEPEKFLKGLNDKDIKANVWINPYVSPDGELYDKIEPYTGSHTVMVWNRA